MRLRLAWIAPLVLAIMAGTGGAPASADTTMASVVVYGSSGAQPAVPITLSELQQTPGCTPYGQQAITENGYDGQQTITLPADAWSVDSILNCTPALHTGTGVSVIVIQPNGDPELGPYSDLSGKPALDSAVISYTLGNNGPDYDRPWNSQPDDYDLPDQVIQAPSGILLQVYNPVTTFPVSISPANGTVAAGAAVTFSASAPGAKGSTSERWSFGGGAPSSTDSSPTVTFNTPGTFDVSVLVTDSRQAVGTVTTTITVNPASGAPPTQTGANPQTGNGTTGGTSPTGPINGHGGTPGTKPGSSHRGAATPTGHGSGSRPSRHPSHQSTKRSPSGTASSPASTTTTSSKPATTPASTSTSTTPTTTQPTAPPARHQPPSHHVTPPQPSPTQGQVVHGLLISDVVALPPDQSPLVVTAQPAAATPPPVRRGVRASLIPGLGAGLAIVLLLALGAGREWRGWRSAALRPRA